MKDKNPKTRMHIMLKYSDQILELVDQRDDFMRGDLQARCEAIVMSLLQEKF